MISLQSIKVCLIMQTLHPMCSSDESKSKLLLFGAVGASYDMPDPCKIPVYLNNNKNNNILTGVMAFVMGIVTVVRVSRRMPNKIVGAALEYAAPVQSADTLVKSQMLQQQQQMFSRVVSPAEFSAVVKRLADMEEKMTNVSMKPAEMPLDKEEMLNAAVSRVEALEAELSTTKKV